MRHELDLSARGCAKPNQNRYSRVAGAVRVAAVRSILVLVLPLTGCASIERQFENRILCTMANDRMMVASMWGPIGIASNVRDADAAVRCKPG